MANCKINITLRKDDKLWIKVALTTAKHSRKSKATLIVANNWNDVVKLKLSSWLIQFLVKFFGSSWGNFMFFFCLFLFISNYDVQFKITYLEILYLIGSFQLHHLVLLKKNTFFLMQYVSNSQIVTQKHIPICSASNVRHSHKLHESNVSSKDTMILNTMQRRWPML
jgi:hypothetical protein